MASAGSAAKVVDHEGEKRVIDQIVALRNQGLTLERIAEVLNTMKVPTKTRKGKWYNESVCLVLKRAREKGLIGSLVGGGPTKTGATLTLSAQPYQKELDFFRKGSVT